MIIITFVPMERVIRIILGILFAVPVIIDIFGAGTTWQYIYNAGYLLVLLPLLIAAPDIKKYEKKNL